MADILAQDRPERCQSSTVTPVDGCRARHAPAQQMRDGAALAEAR